MEATFRKIAVIICLALLSGCLPFKKQDLTHNKPPRAQFEVNLPIDQTYSLLVDRMDQCHAQPTDHVGRVLELVDNPLKKEIYYKSTGHGGIYIMAILLESKASNITSVRVSDHLRPETSHAVKLWLEDDYTECRARDNQKALDNEINTFDVNEYLAPINNKSAFDILAYSLNACIDGRTSMGRPDNMVESVFHKPSNTGHISTYYYGLTGVAEYKMKVLIEQINHSSSLITTNYHPDFKVIADRLPLLINGKIEDCEELYE